MLLKLHTKLAPGWALIQVNFDPMQEIGPKVGGGRSFVSGPFFARLPPTSCCSFTGSLPWRVSSPGESREELPTLAGESPE